MGPRCHLAEAQSSASFCPAARVRQMSREVRSLDWRTRLGKRIRYRSLTLALRQPDSILYASLTHRTQSVHTHRRALDVLCCASSLEREPSSFLTASRGCPTLCSIAPRSYPPRTAGGEVLGARRVQGGEWAAGAFPTRRKAERGRAESTFLM